MPERTPGNQATVASAPSTSKKVLIVINADTSKQPNPPQDRARERMADYTAIKAALQGDILDWNDVAASRWAKLLAKAGGKGIALAALAFARRKRYGSFYCDSENNGLVLAALFKLSRTNRPLLMIGHWITPRKKALIFKYLKLYSHITTIFLHSSTQYNKAIDQLGIPAKRMQLLPYQVDAEFWNAKHSNPAPIEKPYICTAGLECRDYPTFIEAVRGMEVEVKIGAASFWSKRKNNALTVDLPPNVEVRSYTYQELRDLYAGSRFVVVPQLDTDFQGGITVILEAMAMGKAVIVTRSEGQGDTVVDRRESTRNGPTRPTKGKFIELFGGKELEGVDGQTGFYVSPGDPLELRKAIQFLLDHPERAEEMGARGRRTVESLMTVEQFADRIRRVVFENMGESESKG